jgi:hypothetical protein
VTPELLDQRRWQQVAHLVDRAGDLEPVILPPAEGGGILIISQGRAFHFTNFKAEVNVDVSAADTGEFLEGRRNCFRFDGPATETALRVVEELAWS